MGHRMVVQTLADYLEVSPATLMRAMGWDRWPVPRGVSLNRACLVGGALELPTEMAADEPTTVAGGMVLADGVSLPDHVSFIDRFGVARDQSAASTCTSFAGCAVEEGQLGTPGLDLSEAFLYSRTKAIDGESSDGSWLRFTMRVLIKEGVCHEQTWPYRPDRQYLRSRPSDAAFVEAKQYQAQKRIVLTATDSQAIKEQLAANRPVAISVPIFKSTQNSLRFHAEGRFLMQLGTLDRSVGGHAMAVVGYLDDSWLLDHGFARELGGGVFLARNSWGRWATENPLAKYFRANHGYAIIPYKYLQTYAWEAVTVVVPSLVPQAKLAPISSFMVERASATAHSWWRGACESIVTQARSRLEKIDQ